MENRRFIQRIIPFTDFAGFGSRYPVIVCSHCGATALLNWNEEAQHDRWRIKYKKVPSEPPYTCASLRFRSAGWLDADAALDISAGVFVQRQRLQQIAAGDFGWLKPGKLKPPPPLMSAEETVYLALKPASYCETAVSRFAFIEKLEQTLPLLSAFSGQHVVLDTGTLYVTDAKIHLLGQQRDRSHRLLDIRRADFRGDVWRIHVDSGEHPHHYQGFSQVEGVLDAELIVAIVGSLSPGQKKDY
ncbi:MAG TPA: hypothetical protein VJZ27_10425 [Aggregatilineales bacterium]|nr:hypothetical protein [Aggregatilineales bacterium]